MSSKDTQFVKRMRRIQLKPQTSGGEEVKSSTKVRTIGSTRNGSKDRFAVTQGASDSVSGRELNRDALTIVRDRNQLPVRDSSNTGGNQVSIETRTVQVTSRLQRTGSSGSSGSANKNRTGGYSGEDQQISSQSRTVKRFGLGNNRTGGYSGVDQQITTCKKIWIRK